jgi:hypothetical protein
MAKCKKCGHECHCEMMCDECVNDVCTDCDCKEEVCDIPESFTKENV